LALALQIPAIGVSTLEALAFEARQKCGEKRVLSAIDGGRDGTYAAVYDGFGKLIYDPAVVEWATIVELASGADIVAGSAAPRIADTTPSNKLLIGPDGATADIASYIGVALAKGFAGDRPRPLYLRAPDARPQAHLALPRRPS
jgi:tRNA threonylcarbamoyladenosine biosynthesis protein TsaB